MSNKPWPAPSSPEAIAAATHKRRVIIFAVCAAVFVVLVVAGLVNKKSSQPEHLMTLQEAACSYLRDGSTPDQAYSYSKDLASQHPYTYPDAAAAARLAVSLAQAEGC